MQIDRPIFLVGSGRSGTEVLNQLVSMHPDLCWISNVSMRLSMVPCAPLLHRVFDMGNLGLRQKRKILRQEKDLLNIYPIEPDAAYDKMGFRSDMRLTEADYDAQLEARFRKLIQRHMFWANKPRFVSKETANTQRIRLMNRIFPGAFFVHLIRDGRAVASSMEQNNWLESLSLWWAEAKASDYATNFADPIELFGTHWKRNIEELQAAQNLMGDRYQEVRYEDLVADVHGTIERILSLTGLRSDAEYLSMLPESLPNMNAKWRVDLSPGKIAMLEKLIGPKLQELGYELHA
jgi:hypothetical protein